MAIKNDSFGKASISKSRENKLGKGAGDRTTVQPFKNSVNPRPSKGRKATGFTGPSLTSEKSVKNILWVLMVRRWELKSVRNRLIAVCMVRRKPWVMPKRK